MTCPTQYFMSDVLYNHQHYQMQTSIHALSLTHACEHISNLSHTGHENILTGQLVLLNH